MIWGCRIVRNLALGPGSRAQTMTHRMRALGALTVLGLFLSVFQPAVGFVGLQMRTVLVAGATGRVGKNVCEQVWSHRGPTRFEGRKY